MTYRQIKWLILIIPTLTIGLWEYVRHQFLLPYISMELGNWLSPFLVFLVTITFLIKLFSILEGIQEELNKERSAKGVLLEREKIARELHDGIAQSLFLLSVKIDKLEKGNESLTKKTDTLQSTRKTVHQVNEYVRQAIANLRHPLKLDMLPWMESIHQLNADFKNETGISVAMNWTLEEDQLTTKEKVELYACIREALLNIRKHAEARRVWIMCKGNKSAWECIVEDDGKGFVKDPSFFHEGRFGTLILRERAEEMSWKLKFDRQDDKTRLGKSVV